MPKTEHTKGVNANALLPIDEVIYEAGNKPECVYFPSTAIISLPYMKNGTINESGKTGNDEVVGTALYTDDT
jgi:hypothetical protein